MPEKDLDTLSRLVDDALRVAVEIGEKSAAYILSMASLEVSYAIESADGNEPPDEIGNRPPRFED
jgi:hypothetical protein